VAQLRQAAADVIRDCLNVPQLEAQNAKLTLSMEAREEEIAAAIVRAQDQRR